MSAGIAKVLRASAQTLWSYGNVAAGTEDKTAFHILMGLGDALNAASELLFSKAREAEKKPEVFFTSLDEARLGVIPEDSKKMIQSKWDALITYRSPRELLSFMTEDHLGLLGFLEVSEISGGADLLNGMPRTITLKQFDTIGRREPITRRYVQVTDELLLLAKRMTDLAKIDGSLRVQEATQLESEESFHGHLQRLLAIRTEAREKNEGAY